jgi:hypothetical protein
MIGPLLLLSALLIVGGMIGCAEWYGRHLQRQQLADLRAFAITAEAKRQHSRH